MIDKGQWREFGQDTGLPLLLREVPWDFNDHRELGPRFNVSSERRMRRFHAISKEKQKGQVLMEKYGFLTKFEFWSRFPLSLLNLFHFDMVYG